MDQDHSQDCTPLPINPDHWTFALHQALPGFMGRGAGGEGKWTPYLDRSIYRMCIGCLDEKKNPDTNSFYLQQVDFTGAGWIGSICLIGSRLTNKTN